MPSTPLSILKPTGEMLKSIAKVGEESLAKTVPKSVFLK